VFSTAKDLHILFAFFEFSRLEIHSECDWRRKNLVVLFEIESQSHIRFIRRSLMEYIKNISQLKPGQRAKIRSVAGNSPLSQRIVELGFTPGTSVRLIARAAFGGAIAFQIRGTMIALRRSDATIVEVENEQ